MRRFRAITLPLLMSLALVTPLAAQVKGGGGGGDETTVFEEHDPVMNAAIAEAQAGLPSFLAEVLNADGESQGRGTVKVAFQTFPIDHGDEIIWVRDISQRADGQFTGFLNNAPVNLGDWREGSQVQFSYEMIQDWSLTSPAGRLWGNYTTRVIADLPGNGYLWDYLEPAPLPPGW